MAIGTVGLNRDPVAKRLFVAGFREMLERIEPAEIVLVGKILPELESCKNRILQFDSFQTELRRRCRDGGQRKIFGARKW